MKGSAITGPVGKEAAELWPVSLLCSLLKEENPLMYFCSVSPVTLVLSCKGLSFGVKDGWDKNCYHGFTKIIAT